MDGVSGATIEAITQGRPVEVAYTVREEERVEPTITALQEFLFSVRTGKKPISNVETGKDASIAIHMGNAAADTQTFQFWKPEYDTKS